MEATGRKLPHEDTRLYLTAGSLETTMLYEAGLDFPEFASFTLLRLPAARQPMSDFYRTAVNIALENNTGVILSTNTWRANLDWGAKLGYTSQDLAEINTEAVSLLQSIRSLPEFSNAYVLISGCIGPRGDGYIITDTMTITQAEEYHSHQVQALSTAGVDLISGMTFNYSAEAAGLVLACQRVHVPVVVSFTLETDGLLPSHESIHQAIERVDAATDSYPAYYMLNCCHPTHFSHILTPGSPNIHRIRGLQVNASAKSHAELAVCTTIDSGDPVALTEELYGIKERNSQIVVLGGCCGTDFRHIRCGRL